ncbi:MAG: LON peptidase substrate-binding domain-containing protein [Candidatus Neomarinimicrobiota bacterium]
MVKLPLFPLNLVLLPFEYLPLHIFEPRYKTMIRNAIEQDVPFGIVLSKGEGVHSKGVKVGVKEVFKKHSNGEYDILVKGQEIFKVMNTELEGETIVGQVEYLPVQTSLKGDYFKSFQDSYLKILLKFGVDKDLEIHMRKKISYEFLQGLQLPLVLKKELLEIDDEISRLEFIENIFNNVLDTDTAPSNGNMPQA